MCEPILSGWPAAVIDVTCLFVNVAEVTGFAMLVENEKNGFPAGCGSCFVGWVAGPVYVGVPPGSDLWD